MSTKRARNTVKIGFSGDYRPRIYRLWASLVGLITRRSQVRILPPLYVRKACKMRAFLVGETGRTWPLPVEISCQNRFAACWRLPKRTVRGERWLREETLGGAQDLLAGMFSRGALAFERRAISSYGPAVVASVPLRKTVRTVALAFSTPSWSLLARRMAPLMRSL